MQGYLAAQIGRRGAAGVLEPAIGQPPSQAGIESRNFAFRHFVDLNYDFRSLQVKQT